VFPDKLTYLFTLYRAKCSKLKAACTWSKVGCDRSVGRMQVYHCLLSLWLGFNSRAWWKIAQSPFNGTTQPVDIEEGGQNPTMDRHGRNIDRASVPTKDLHVQVYNNNPSCSFRHPGTIENEYVAYPLN